MAKKLWVAAYDVASESEEDTEGVAREKVRAYETLVRVLEDEFEFKRIQESVFARSKEDELDVVALERAVHAIPGHKYVESLHVFKATIWRDIKRRVALKDALTAMFGKGKK